MIRNIFIAIFIFSSIPVFGQETGIPASIRVSESNTLIMHAYAKGVQVYICGEDPKDTSHYVWVFKEPRATLYADSTFNRVIGKHYFDAAHNPTWENVDGSKVTGAKVQQANSPDGLAIPWLLLKSTHTQGRGILKATSFIQRIFTHGGKAPPEAQKSEKGKTLEVPYTAEYVFFSEK